MRSDVDLVVNVWAEDCVVSGRVLDPVPERLSDRLNAAGAVQLGDVTVSALDEERSFTLESLALGLDDLCLIELVGSRGHPERRRWTVRRPIAVEVGPYLVIGSMHVLPGVNPLAAFRHRPPIVPLTDAVVELAGGSRPLRWEVAVVGLNQSRIGTVREVPETPADWRVEDEPEAGSPA